MGNLGQMPGGNFFDRQMAARRNETAPTNISPSVNIDHNNEMREACGKANEAHGQPQKTSIGTNAFAFGSMKLPHYVPKHNNPAPQSTNVSDAVLQPTENWAGRNKQTVYNEPMAIQDTRTVSAQMHAEHRNGNNNLVPTSVQAQTITNGYHHAVPAAAALNQVEIPGLANTSFEKKTWVPTEPQNLSTAKDDYGAIAQLIRGIIVALAQYHDYVEAKSHG
jgi:hypothetical protein